MLCKTSKKDILVRGKCFVTYLYERSKGQEVLQSLIHAWPQCSALFSLYRGFKKKKREEELKQL